MHPDHNNGQHNNTKCLSLFLLLFQFTNPTSGFKFATLRGSAFETFFTESDDPTYRKIGQNMKPYGVKSGEEGINKLHSG